MKIYKHWAVEKQKILIDGAEQQITCYGGSNTSIEDAQSRATEKAEKIKRKIKGEKHLFDEYEVEIREEILEIIDDHSAITRNRYGAHVLNTEGLLILDIDKPKATFADIFRKQDVGQDKLKIFDMVRKLASSPRYQRYGFRARLTPKPYRMKMRRYKVQYPREEDDAELRQWLADYERESRNFSVCRFIEQVGARHSVSDVVRLHDEISGVNYRQPLA